MPPKPAAKAAGPSKKTEAKKKEKIIEDKTFGLKNKKGAKNQKFIQQVQHQVKYGGQVAAKKVDEMKKLESKKDDKKKEQLELNQLFRPVTTQKVEKGADPKSVVCAFYKQGQCTKGDKCKFSHDVTIERKAEKRSVYVDMRDDELDGMENWDEEKLKEVVDKKHAEMDKKNPKTEIICKYFLEALEKSKYGWFWECPNGEKCFYRHALPPGFVLKKDKKKDDKVSEISIEELVEKERANLGVKQTKITLESFLAWKKNKITEKIATADKEAARKKAEFKAGRNVGISGREMFTFRPELAADDQMEEGEATFDTSHFSRDEDDDELSAYTELTIESLAAQARECDGSGTIAPQQRMYENQMANDVTGAESGGAIGGTENGIDGPSDLAHDIPIDEALFLEDDDLEELERDLEGITVDS